MRSIILSIAAMLAVSTPAVAEVPALETKTCPVGGAKFTYNGYAAYSTYGRRPDGKPFGSTSFPLRLPICPNGFIVLREDKDYTAADKTMYAAIIARDTYKTMMRTETDYYRAAYLERESNGKPGTIAYLMLQATWQADTNPAQHKRYQEELVAYIDRVLAPASRTSVDYWIFQYFAANAQRQLGLFDASLARLAAIRAAGPPEKLSDDSEWSRDGFLEMVTEVETLAKARDAGLGKDSR